MKAKKAAEASSPKKAAATSDTPQVSASVRKKLSFKDKHELETLPAKIEKLQAEIQKLRDVMADPGFYERDAKGFATATSRLGTASEELQNCEDRWLELEMLREQLGA